MRGNVGSSGWIYHTDAEWDAWAAEGGYTREALEEWYGTSHIDWVRPMPEGAYRAE